MTRTLLAMVILCLSVTGGLARHLMHNIPLDVGREIEEKCNKASQSSAFAEGSCIDKDAAEWLRTHPGEERSAPPDEPVQGTITLPGLLDQPENKDIR